MKLISNFSDYYDTALSEGRDESVLFVRKRGLAEINLSDDILPWRSARAVSRWSRGVNGFSVRDKNSMLRWEQFQFDEAFVLVAGKAFPVLLSPGLLEFHMDDTKASGPLGDVDEQVIFNRLEANQVNKKNLMPGKKSSDWVITRHLRQADKKAYDQSRVQFLGRDFSSLHLNMEAPVLLVASPTTLFDRLSQAPRTSKNTVIIKNPNLSRLGFQRTLHPYTCFQDISQFIAGVAPGHQMPMVEVSDKSQVIKKGFDPKYGFRKRPEGMR